MAPRLIPPTPSFQHASEKVVWERLKAQLPQDAFLAANVHLHSHEDFYEADLVVGLPGVGFAVIEVKGGHLTHDDEGWKQFTKDGPKLIDPAGQADRAKRLLDIYARDRGWRHGPIRFESLVAFPDTDLGPEAPAADTPRWSVIARGDLDRAGDMVFEALNRRPSTHHRPSVAQVAEMADLLGGRGDPQAALLGVAAARAEHVRRLTEEQFAVLDAFKRNPRIYVSGGPGTGKTWLALEQARRYATAGDHVLVVCYSVGLARWLKAAVTNMKPEKVADRITVRTFQAVGVGLGIEVPEGAAREWWEAELPRLMAERVVPSYDALVVDEAQDFADAWWPPLLALLRKNQLFIAGDEQQAVFSGRRGMPAGGLVEMTLSANLRNTQQIAAVINPLARDRMTYLGGSGPEVRLVTCGSSEAYDSADREVERLMEAGHPAGSITVLTTRHRHPYHRQTEEALGKEGLWDGFWLEDEVFYSTVMGFKGLERPVVVLAVDGFHEGVARDVMYAGLSRARDELVVCGDAVEIGAAVGKEVLKRLGGR